MRTDAKTTLFTHRWPLAALFILPLLLAWPSFTGQAWAAGDLVRQFHPWKELGRQALLHGHLPLWNPYAYCGMPLFANFQSALAYPFHFPFYVLSFSSALGLHLFFHFFISALGFYALGLALGLSRGPALLAALCWQANAFLLARVEFMSALSAYAWTPWILWAAASKQSPSRLAVLVALQALAGYPLELAYTLLSALTLCVFLNPKDLPRNISGFALGYAASAFLLFPGLELLSHSSRLAGGPDAATFEVLRLRHLSAWLLPGALPWNFAFTLGLPTLALAWLAKGRPAFWAATILVIGLALSSGLGSSLFPNRHPALALVLCSTSLALLTGLGLQSLSPRTWISAALAALSLAPALWILHNKFIVSSSVFEPSETSRFLSQKLSGTRRLLVSPAVQLELESSGPDATSAWRQFPYWLQANTPAPSGIHDANGYDPLAPAEIVKLLNASSFPNFAKNPALLDLLGVETLADWDPQSGRFHLALTRRPHPPLRAALSETPDALALDTPLSPDSIRPEAIQTLLHSSDRWPIQLHEDGPNSLTLTLPPKHPAGWLFFNDTFYTGWKAWTDTTPAPIHRALGAFRAVEIGVETKIVRMAYRPWSFMLGAAVSLLACLAIIGLASLQRD